MGSIYSVINLEKLKISKYQINFNNHYNCKWTLIDCSGFRFYFVGNNPQFKFQGREL